MNASNVLEYDAWEHICADAFDNPKKGVIALVFPLTAYFDAGANYPSPTRPDPPLLHTVGCYLARYDDWKKFRKEWRKELDKKEVCFFHMKDFEYALAAIRRGERHKIGRKNPFKELNEDEFVPLLRRVHGVINRKKKDGSYRMVEFASSVVKPDFDKTLPDELKNDPECKSYYILNVSNVMKMIALWCSTNVIYDPIHYIFAGGDGEGGNIEKWFRFCWNSEQDRGYYRLNKGYTRMGYDIQEMEAEPAIQAADIAAFEFNKVAQEIAQRGNVDIPLDELRKSLPSLGRAPHYSLTLTEENLPGAFAQIITRRKSTGML
jgi:hypothetical protein